MKVIRYEKIQSDKMPSLLAEFDVETDKLLIRGCKVLKGKIGWFVVLPSIKTSQGDWKAAVECLNIDHHKALIQGIREAVNDYTNS